MLIHKKNRNRHWVSEGLEDELFHSVRRGRSIRCWGVVVAVAFFCSEHALRVIVRIAFHNRPLMIFFSCFLSCTCLFFFPTALEIEEAKLGPTDVQVCHFPVYQSHLRFRHNSVCVVLPMTCHTSLYHTSYSATHHNSTPYLTVCHNSVCLSLFHDLNPGSFLSLLLISVSLAPLFLQLSVGRHSVQAGAVRAGVGAAIESCPAFRACARYRRGKVYSRWRSGAPWNDNRRKLKRRKKKKTQIRTNNASPSPSCLIIRGRWVKWWNITRLAASLA